VIVVNVYADAGVCEQFAAVVGPDAEFHQISSSDG